MGWSGSDQWAKVHGEKILDRRHHLQCWMGLKQMKGEAHNFEFLKRINMMNLLRPRGNETTFGRPDLPWFASVGTPKSCLIFKRALRKELTSYDAHSCGGNPCPSSFPSLMNLGWGTALPKSTLTLTYAFNLHRFSHWLGRMNRRAVQDAQWLAWCCLTNRHLCKSQNLWVED